jgi:hypothetical protein
VRCRCFRFTPGIRPDIGDGNTLVIDTAGFNNTTFLDNSGAPHADQLRHRALNLLIV